MTDTTDRPTETEPLEYLLRNGWYGVLSRANRATGDYQHRDLFGVWSPSEAAALQQWKDYGHAEEIKSLQEQRDGAEAGSHARLDLLCRVIREKDSLRAALTTDRDALIAANIEETARADSEKQRADSAEKEAKELRDRIFPPVKSVVITAPMAPALSIQELCAPIAANLSPEQSAEAENGTTAFGREYWEGRGK